MALPVLTAGPPAWLEPDARQIWADIRAACPARLAGIDGFALATTSALVAGWRRHGGDLAHLRLCYRGLGHFFIAMPTRRALLFPERPRRS